VSKAMAKIGNTRWSCCLFTLFFFLAVVVLLVIVAWMSRRWQRSYQLAESRDRWERQVADVKAGKRTCLIWPEPRFLEEFVKNQPDAAAKVTGVEFYIGKVSDERFGYLRQLPHLEAIHFYEVWEGADSFLSRIKGMEALTRLSFSKTPLSEEGVRTIASFPHLKRLHIDYMWKETSLKPVSGHKSIEVLVLDDVPITKELTAVMASLPKLREVHFEDSDTPITKAERSDLQKALPNVKIF
jgi:hypothetical protein